MFPQQVTSGNELARNGRTPAENKAYTDIARAGISRQSQLDKTAKMRAARRANVAAAITEAEGSMPADVLERRVTERICADLARARAKALTARRQLRQAREREAAAIAAQSDADATIAELAPAADE